MFFTVSSNFLKSTKQIKFPATLGILFILFSYFTGLFQPLEWKIFDAFLRLRPEEPTDKRITIIGIDDIDIQQTGLPITDDFLADIITTVDQYNPRVIGIDIYRHLSKESSSSSLSEIFKNKSHIIGIESVFAKPQIEAHPALPEEQIGSVDLIEDEDRNFRRDLLAFASADEGKIHVGMTVRLVELYLKSKDGQEFQVCNAESPCLTIGEKSLPRFTANTGAYVRAIDGGSQVLVNPRNGEEPFRKISFRELQSGNFNPDFLKDRIVLIGMTALIVDTFDTKAFGGVEPELIHSVDFRAHAVSQILSAYEDDRPLIWSLHEPLEIALSISSILLLVGIYIKYQEIKIIPLAPFFVWMAPIVAIFIACLISYLLLLIFALWIPIFAISFSFFNSAILIYGLNIGSQEQQAKILERDAVIKEAFDKLHAGPLQTLNQIQKSARKSEIPIGILQDINQLEGELRSIKETLRLDDSRYAILEGEAADIGGSLNAMVEERITLTQNWIGQNLNLSYLIKDTHAVSSDHLSPQEKADICMFLHNAICNVSKHSISPKKLEVTLKEINQIIFLRIEDNGLLPNSSKNRHNTRKEEGTAHAQELARKLKGTLAHGWLESRGYFIELSFPSSYSPWQQAFRNLKGLFQSQ